MSLSKASDKLNTVVQNNVLITATHILTRNELLTFKKIISIVDTCNKKREIKFKKEDLVGFLWPDIVKKNADSCGEYYTKTKKYCEKLMNTILKFNTTEFEKMIAFCAEITWENYNDKITIILTPEIMPYIYELKKNFTQYQIGNLQKLKSANAARIYEYCKMNIHGKKWTWQISLGELKKMLGVEKKYKGRFEAFDRVVLKKSLKNINEKTDIQVKYKKIRNHRKINSIEFTAENIFL